MMQATDVRFERMTEDEAVWAEARFILAECNRPAAVTDPRSEAYIARDVNGQAEGVLF